MPNATGMCVQSDLLSKAAPAGVSRGCQQTKWRKGKGCFWQKEEHMPRGRGEKSTVPGEACRGGGLAAGWVIR